MAFGALLAAGVGGAATERTAAVPDKALARAITPGHLRTHIQALARIASRNDGNRAAGTPGYSQSVDYVANQMRAAGYLVTVQDFIFDRFEETAPPVFQRTTPTARTYVQDGEFATMDYSGSGDVTARLVAVGGIVIPSPGGSETEGVSAGVSRPFLSSNFQTKI